MLALADFLVVAGSGGRVAEGSERGEEEGPIGLFVPRREGCSPRIDDPELRVAESAQHLRESYSHVIPDAQTPWRSRRTMLSGATRDGTRQEGQCRPETWRRDLTSSATAASVSSPLDAQTARSAAGPPDDSAGSAGETGELDAEMADEPLSIERGVFHAGDGDQAAVRLTCRTDPLGPEGAVIKDRGVPEALHLGVGGEVGTLKAAMASLP